ncbi:cupin domain-containing protein [Proteiniphilum acetatigenes]|uniref:cupin domain-containing protein n=1 Tax=Proteiniphilum acetatigenes TaxID=294710 RepID=UPI00035CD568|nr:cupin domain-containing protein [Proteiniphilum acetatigenes]SFL27788.1 Cupin domain protein [Porphyromonadaceae bacterium KH3CP3RA]
MKQIEKISEGKNHTAINIGNLDDIKSYSLIHTKTGKEVNGKVFLKEPTNATGTEISFTVIPPKSELGYFHVHNKDEETYIILKGSGYYQVDADCFPIQEGSIIRVAPNGVRGLCNTSDDEMLYICIQSKENSLEEHTTDDGKRIRFTPKWETI